MTSEEMAHLFDRFSQASRRTNLEYGGSGLGLSISRKLIELMEGTIQVESEKWRGSQFSFTAKCAYLSLGEQKRAEKKFLKKKKATLSPVNLLEGKKILIVEDCKINQKILVNLMKSKGCIYEVGNDGLEAVEVTLSIKL